MATKVFLVGLFATILTSSTGQATMNNSKVLSTKKQNGTYRPQKLEQSAQVNHEDNKLNSAGGENAGPTNLHNLPNRVLGNVMSLLTPPHWRALQLTSRRLYQQITENPETGMLLAKHPERMRFLLDRINRSEVIETSRFKTELENAIAGSVNQATILRKNAEYSDKSATSVLIMLHSDYLQELSIAQQKSARESSNLQKKAENEEYNTNNGFLQFLASDPDLNYLIWSWLDLKSMIRLKSVSTSLRTLAPEKTNEIIAAEKAKELALSSIAPFLKKKPGELRDLVLDETSGTDKGKVTPLLNIWIKLDAYAQARLLSYLLADQKKIRGEWNWIAPELRPSHPRFLDPARITFNLWTTLNEEQTKRLISELVEHNDYDTLAMLSLLWSSPSYPQVKTEQEKLLDYLSVKVRGVVTAKVDSWGGPLKR